MNYGKAVIGVRLLLLRDYLQANAGKNRIVSRRELTEYLQTQGYEVEKKTLYKDFALLDSVFGMQIEYDPHKKGYRLLNPPFEPYELRLMVDGIQSSKFITKEKAREITAKIRTLAGKDVIESLDRQAYVADRVRSMNDSVVKDADRIHTAIKNDNQIGFRYFHYRPSSAGSKKYSKSGEQFVVSPYALLWNNGNYYLYAYDAEGKKFRYFRVDRMEHISHPLPIPREGKENFKEKDITAQKVKVFDMYSGKEYVVKIRFRNELADAVIDQFGKDVMMIPSDDEHFTINVAVQISPPFFAWIATFGRRVKILSPEPVVEKMRDFLTRSLDMYNDDGEK
ncbi:MAG: WYL domain-containing protein [Clostridia bacterium]|nr:WYL domain-containing protein [Clostridia bacterium]